MNIIDNLGGRRFIEYIFAAGDEQPIRAVKYEYLLAGNGVFIRAGRREFSVCLPLCRIRINGLPPVRAEITWHGPGLPGRIWGEMLSDVRRRTHSSDFREDVYVVYRPVSGTEWQWKNITRDQTYASAMADDSQEEYGEACLELHTHPPGALQFSRADDRDEEGKFRLFAILADIHSPRPKIRFRGGIYDHFVQLPAILLGELPEEFIDLNASVTVD